MCGIIGIISKDNKNVIDLALKMLSKLMHRGQDGFGLVSGNGDVVKDVVYERFLDKIKGIDSNIIFLHNRLAIIGTTIQPIIEDNLIFGCNGEIYNYKDLAEKRNISYNRLSDVAIVAKLFREYTKLDAFVLSNIKNEMDGDYACYLFSNDQLFLFRDPIGVKPLWYGFDGNNFVFASERKAIWSIGEKAIPLHPEDLLIFDVKKFNIRLFRRIFALDQYFSYQWRTNDNIKTSVTNHLRNAVKKRVENLSRYCILFSGGLDSAVILQLAKEFNSNVNAYTTGLKGSEDLNTVEDVAIKMDVSLNFVHLDEELILQSLPIVIRAIEDYNPIKVSVALSLFNASKKSSEDGNKVIFTGLGAEEIFAGYKKYQDLLSHGYYAVHDACVEGIKNIWHRDLYYSDTITMANTQEVRVPYLDFNLILSAMKIHPSLKISPTMKKIILRKIAEEIGVSQKIAWRPKKAAQYGSGVDKILKKIIKRKGYSHTLDYFLKIYKTIYKN